MNKKTILVLTALSAALVGCVNAPKGLEKEQFTLKSLSSIQPSDYSCQCKSIRLGGKVLTAQALPNKTKIEVLSYPVYSTSARDRKSTRLNSSHPLSSRMPSSA